MGHSCLCRSSATIKGEISTPVVSAHTFSRLQNTPSCRVTVLTQSPSICNHTNQITSAPPPPPLCVFGWSTSTRTSIVPSTCRSAMVRALPIERVSSRQRGSFGGGCHDIPYRSSHDVFPFGLDHGRKGKELRICVTLRKFHKLGGKLDMLVS
jgi:hypothetical protein